VAAFFKGYAGTGKSLLLKNIGKSYATEDVGLLSNNIETTFGLAAQHDKLGIIATELNANFSLDQTMWQNMVSGDPVVLARKRKTALNIPEWQTGILMGGNEIMKCFEDKSGSVSRRLLMFLFDQPVPIEQGDSNLKYRVYEELPALMAAANRIYLQVVEQHAAKNIWNVLPDYFKKTQQDVSANTDPVFAFLSSADDIEFGANFMTPFDQFSTAFRTFLENTGRQRIQLTADVMFNAFRHFKLKKVRRMVERQRQFFVEGCQFNH
jgi:phage/plasmid-associated DNA primase